MLRSLFYTLSWFALISCSAWDTLAQDELDQRAEAEVSAAQRELVKQLGDSSFHTRQRAAEEFVRQGVAANAALTEALKDPDPEIRWRARSLLKRVHHEAFEARLAAFVADVEGKQQHNLPGWKPFRELVGDHRDAREMFAAMTRRDAELLSAYEEQAPELPKLYAGRIDGLKAKAKSGNSDLPVDTQPSLATLLLIGCDNDIEDRSKLTRQLYQLLLYEQTAVQAIGTEIQPPVLRTLLEEWASASSYYGSKLALKYNLEEEGLQQALDLLEKGGRTSSSSLRYAAIILGRFGSEEHAHLLTPLLGNKTVCNRWSNKAIKEEGTIDTQVRDVALVVLLHLRGKEPKQYGFNLLRENPETLYHSYTFGFVDDEEREAAHAKWAAESKMDEE